MPQRLGLRQIVTNRKDNGSKKLPNSQVVAKGRLIAAHPTFELLQDPGRNLKLARRSPFESVSSGLLEDAGQLQFNAVHR